MPEPDLTRGLRFPAFGGLRALAAISVAVTHASYISSFNVQSSDLGPITSRLDIGVAVFFVISGFLLYRPFALAHLSGKPRPTLRDYARRRFLRIIPAYWLVLTVVLAIPVLRPHNVKLTPLKILTHYLLIHIYASRLGLPPVQQSWTLATEVAFYAFLPLFAFALARFGRSDRRQALTIEVAAVVGLYVFGLAWRAYLLKEVTDRGSRGLMSLWLPARMDHFALGMLVAVLSANEQARGRAMKWAQSRALPYAAWLIAGGAFIFLCYGFGLDTNRGPGAMISHAQEWWLYALWGIVGVFAILPAVFGPQEGSFVHGILRDPVIAWLGVVSYGVYLWHEAAIDFLLRWKHLDPANSFPIPYNFPLMTFWMLALTIPLAALSWYGLERYALRIKDRPLFGSRGSRATSS